MTDEKILEDYPKENFYYSVLKLTCGDLLISAVNMAGIEEDMIVELHNPVQIFNVPVFADDGRMYEKTMLQEYLPYSRIKMVTVHAANIVYISPLSPEYVKKYIDFLSVAEATKTKEFPSYVSDVDEDEEEDDRNEELGESEPEVPETKKWLH
jgi:hypothetical protein